MTHIRMIAEDEADGQVADDYEFFAGIYSQGDPERRAPIADVFRASSIVPPYCHFTAIQLGLITDQGRAYLESPDATVPRMVPVFSTAMFSSCFY